MADGAARNRARRGSAPIMILTQTASPAAGARGLTSSTSPWSSPPVGRQSLALRMRLVVSGDKAAEC
jgi:hypothetical protein